MTLPSKKISSKLIFIPKYVDLRTCRKNGAYLCMSHLASFLSLTPPSPQCNLVLFFGHKKNVLRGWPKKISMIIMMVARIIMIIIMVISSYGNIEYRIYLVRFAFYCVHIAQSFQKNIDHDKIDESINKLQRLEDGRCLLVQKKEIVQMCWGVTKWSQSEELRKNWRITDKVVTKWSPNGHQIVTK